MCDGLLSVDVLPSPNVQYQDVGELVDASVNAAVIGADPEVGVPVKLATGAATGVGVGVGVGTTDVTLIYPVRVRVLLPAAFVAFRDTVYVPAVL